MAGESFNVGVIGTPAGQGLFQYEGGGPDWHAPTGELPKVEIEAAGTDSLRDVLIRAAAALGVSLTPMASGSLAANREARGTPSAAEAVVEMIAYAGFRREDDDEPGDGTEGVLRRDSRARKHTVLLVRDESGRAVWRRPPFTATIGELVDAAEAGLLDGDPLQPYLILVIPQGVMGLPGEWPQLLQELEAAWHLSGIAAQIAGALSFLGVIRRFAARHSGKAAAVVRSNSQAWSERGAAPADLEELLKSKPRSAAQVAALLGCTQPEAEAILWAFGLTPRRDGAWVGGDRAHR